MKKYIIRLSASGALCLTAVGCGVDEEQTVTMESEKFKEVIEDNCESTQSDEAVQQFLNELEKQGRVGCVSNSALQQIDRHNMDDLPK